MHEFKVGDKVVVKAHPSGNNSAYNSGEGFINKWLPVMDTFIGNIYTIKRIEHTGVEMYEVLYCFPPTSLELIEEVTPEKANSMFKVGQKVWCVALGEGTVSSITDEGSTYPVNVKFSGGMEEFYTEDGKLFLSGNRTLFFSPPIISAETEPPFVSTLVGKKVLLESNKVDFMGIVTVLDETADKIYTDSFGNYWCKDAVTVYEITPVTFKD